MTSRIAIIGAGPAGLTLAGLLRRAKIDCTIFEKDASESWAFGRSGSGTLDLHVKSGLRALERLDLLERFTSLARYNVPFRIADSQGTIYLDIEGEDTNDKPEIDRRDLRALLLEVVPAENIRWGSKVRTVEKAADNTMTVHLADGKYESGFHLVVGADGHWSKARAVITPVEPEYHGVTFVTSWLRPGNTEHATAVSLAGDGLYVALKDNKGIVIARLRDGTYQVGAMLRVPENWHVEQAPLLEDPITLRDGLLEHFANWSQPIQNIISRVEGTFHMWPQYSLPDEALRWEHVSGVTLIGDAAHLTVSGGHGVNSALCDACLLAQRIEENGIDAIDIAAKSYEEEMLPRSRQTLERANAALKNMVSPHAPHSWLQALKGSNKS